MAPAAVSELQQLKTQAAQRDKEMQTLTQGMQNLVKGFGQVMDRLNKMPLPGHPDPNSVLGAPNYMRRDALGDRGFSFMKMMGLVTGAVNKDEATVEYNVHEKLHKCFDKTDAGYQWGAAGITGAHRFLAPLSTSYLQEGVVPHSLRMEMKQLVCAGTDGADLDHMKWIRQKQLRSMGYGAKALSWLNEFTGGALVAPPEMGELIELLRNKEALVNAGARVVPLPPQGRLKYPRQTLASNTYWVGENFPITASDIGTGEVTLQAKKLAVLIKAPNELIRFASPAAEAILRDDMTKSLALGLDLAGLEGAGGDTQPEGIIQKQNINRVNSSKQTGNGDFIVGQDIYRMIAIVEENNAEFEGWIMRPKTLYKFYQLRADAVSQSDSSGPFLFNLIREAGDQAVETLAGFPVTKSTQVSMARAKGTATNLSYILGGMWSDVLIGMFGAIEFAATTMGDTPFTLDQTWIRGILSADITLRHEVAFSLLDNLDTTL